MRFDHLIDLMLDVHRNAPCCGGLLDKCRLVAQDPDAEAIVESYLAFKAALSRTSAVSA